MAEIIIPERLTARLSHDKTWDSCVTQFKKNIEPHLVKDPDFFPDYTIHGIDHINRALDIADHLIDFDTLSEEPKKTDLLTPRDVAFLVCGIILHDMGMFLRPDGVRKLVQMDHTDDAFGDKPWKDEWSDYVDRTKRLSQEKVRYHFGKVIPVTGDCVNHTNYDDNKRIIGEFLRQHHARLAHEFAVGVLPGSEGTDLFENTGLKEKDRKLIGLLARSHGMAIRDTESYVEKHFGKGAKPYNTPVFYLMTVLRTADALDADEQRAPEKLEQQQKIDVPISVEEWTWNQCIDPYACDWRMEQKNRHIEADPKSSSQYMQLDKWLKNVQADLDLCWSILAEKYSHPSDRYRLSIHRVVSNIHEPDIRETMNKTFLTKEAKITANPEIVKLLMEPLYGDEPTYGVRELLQNAVDACVERKKWEEDHGNSDYKGLVDIRIENDVFTITDNGMGMNEDVLLNYYLSAGASYRSSDAWMAANAPEGESQVARTGKFGVGFLASFLLGDEIEVHTQHREDEKGYQFTFSQEFAPLNVERLKRTEPGTTITVRLKPTAIKKWYDGPKWYNWYAFDSPVVSYTIDGRTVEHQKLRLHRPPTRNNDWLELPSDDFEAYHWKPNLNSSQPEFYCNGIRIYHEFSPNMAQSKPEIHYPHISILDKQGKLAVDLARKKVAEIPMEKKLLREVLRWHIARLLLTSWDSQKDHRQNLTQGFALRTDDPHGRLPFLLAHRGFNLNYASLIPALSVTDYVVLYYEGRDTRTAARDFLWEDKPCTIVIGNYDTPATFTDDLLANDKGLLASMNLGYTVYKHTCSVWFRPDVPAFLTERSRNRMSLLEPATAAHLLTYCCNNRKSDMPIATDQFPVEQFPAAFHVELDLSDSDFRENLDTLFVEMMKELLTPEPGWPQDLWIPFDMNERKKKFRKAFKELKIYMDHIRKYPVE